VISPMSTEYTFLELSLRFQVSEFRVQVSSFRVQGEGSRLRDRSHGSPSDQHLSFTRVMRVEGLGFGVEG
jgi:hypothetical protein